MKSQLVGGRAESLFDAIRTYDEDPSVQGLMLLVADGCLPDVDRVDQVLQEVVTPVFGGVFPQVLYQGECHTDGIVVAGLSVEPAVSVVPDLSDPGTSFEQHLPGTVPEGGTAFVLVDAFSTRVEEFVSQLFTTYGVNATYLGGGAGSMDMEQRPCLLTDDGVLEDAALFATVDVSTSVGVRHGWEEIAGPLRVTGADGPRLSELNGEPAFSVYRRIVEDDAGTTIETDDFFDVAKMYPFGIRRLDGEMIVRDPFEVTDDGTLTCFGAVSEDAFLHVLKGREQSLVDAAGEAYSEAASKNDSGDVLFFDCISRVLYLEDAFGRELDAVGGAGSPQLGALTLGEIANDGEGHLDYYNKTAVVARSGSL